MSNEEFMREFADIVDMPAGSLNGSERLEDLEGWNSMAMVSFIALADEHFEKSLSPRQFKDCNTVSDLARLVGV